MKFYKNKLIGFTLAEVLVVFFIIGVVASAIIGISQLQVDVAKKYQYYSVFTNLKQTMGEIIAAGGSIGSVKREAYANVISTSQTWRDLENSYESCYTHNHSSGMLKLSSLNECDAQVAAVNAAYPAFLAAVNTSNTQSATKGMPDSKKLPLLANMSASNEAGTTFVQTRDSYNYPANEYYLVSGLCSGFSSVINIIGTTDCALTKSSGVFASGDANFISSSGMRFFNFGKDPVLNADIPVDHNKDYYDVYVDIDGAFGEGLLDSDVMRFKIYRSGQVIPAVASVGGTSKKYMAASVKYDSGGGAYVWLDKNVSYLEAACHAGTVKAPDCPAGQLLKDPCTVTIPTPVGKYTCEVVISKP